MIRSSKKISKLNDTLLVTGGCGFIGSHVADYLIESGKNVLVLDDLSTGDINNLSTGAHFRQGSMTDRSFLESIFNEFSICGIIHEASHINTNVKSEDPKFDVVTNVLGTINLIELALKYEITKFVYASSVAVYGHFIPMPALEEGPVAPVHSYGIAKLCAENYINYYKNIHGFKANIARYGNIYGPRQPIYGEVGVIAIFADKIEKEQPLPVYGDGEHIRDFLFIEDAVEATIALFNHTEMDTFNVASGKGVSVNQIFSQMEKCAPYPLKRINQAERVGEFREFYSDISKISEKVGWYPKIDLAEGIALTLDNSPSKK